MKEVLAQIKPGKEEQNKFGEVTTTFLKKLNSKLKDAKAILGGSGAKGTWLSGNFDVDVFVLFDLKNFTKKTNELSNILEPLLKKSFPKIKLTRLHGSRDYFQLLFQEINFEIIPILNIKKAEQALNITDVSPLHSLWVNKHTAKIKDEILLAKKFCKAQNCYGAESHIGGFSGYTLEILTTRYGSFTKLLKASLKWNEKDVIDVEKYYHSPAEAIFQMNTSKLQSPLIVIDPVDKNRNAAAALSLEKFHLFQKKAAEYLEKPSVEFFQKDNWNLEFVKKTAHGAPFLVLSLTPLEGKIDVVGTKILKLFEFLKRELAPFGIKKANWQWDENNPALLYFILEKAQLPEVTVRIGPPLTIKEHAAAFQKQYPETYAEKGRLFAKIKTPHPLLKDYVKELLKEKYVKERVKEVKVI